MNPIRIKYRENVDHFAEAQEQQPPARPLLPERTVNILLGFLIGGAILFQLVQEYRRGVELKIILVTAVAVPLILLFWLWLFKKIGIYKKGLYPKYVWTEKDRARFKARYLKQTGQEETMAVCEFDESGFRFGADTGAGSFNFNAWPEVKRVVEREKGVLVFTRRIGFYWFPKKAFETQTSYAEVLALMKSKVVDFQRWQLTVVAIGSNLGDSRKNINKIFERIQEMSDEEFSRSSLWQTTPVDCPPGSPKFLNAVVAFVPQKGETPESLLAKLQALEKVFGRQPKKVLNEPRLLDLDLIAFGKETRNTPELILPHPRAHLRRFVLAPLNEIAPDLILPGQSQPVSALLAGLVSDEHCERI